MNEPAGDMGVIHFYSPDPNGLRSRRRRPRDRERRCAPVERQPAQPYFDTSCKRPTRSDRPLVRLLMGIRDQWVQSLLKKTAQKIRNDEPT
jgi:hypothetical protein